MKLKNKKTGEIREIREILVDGMFKVSSLAELKDWEDYEEPKTAWYIDPQGDIREWRNAECDDWSKEKAIGNYFETKEEAEKAVEKLKAWKRLKDKGLRFDGWKCTGSISFTFDNYCGYGQPISASDDLDLLFGGEE